MLVRIERTGGFGGLRKQVVVDSKKLSVEDAEKLQQDINTAKFFELPEKFPLPEHGADYFVYRITVETENKKHTVEVTEPMIPDTLRPLVSRLK